MLNEPEDHGVKKKSKTGHFSNDKRSPILSKAIVGYKGL